MRWSKRAQTSVEFIVLTGFMLFVFTAFIFIVRERTASANQQERYNELASVAQMISQEVSNAYRVQDGYSRSFELPDTLHDEPYEITITGNSELVLKTGNEEFLLFLPVNVSVLDAGGAPTTNLAPGKVTIAKADGNISMKGTMSEPDICRFSNSYGLPVSCYPSTGGGCTTASGETECTVSVSGTPGQTVTWMSSCTSRTYESVFDGTVKYIDITCDTPRESYTCRFIGTSRAQQCWSSVGSCAGYPTCPTPEVSGMQGTTVTWSSSCGTTNTTTLDTETSNNVITFDCSNPVTERITCLFLENPTTGASRTCYALHNHAINCTAPPSTGSANSECTITQSFPPGQGVDWASDECRGGVSMLVTGENKTLPFFCSLT